MATTKAQAAPRAAQREAAAEARYEEWAAWPVNWTAVWVGALASLAAVLVFGLIGIALGAHLIGPEHRVVDLRTIGIGTLVFSVCGAFFAFVIGGWVTGKIAGILHAETGMLHGAVTWLLATPLLLLLATAGAGSFFGGWYGGLAGGTTTAPFERPDAPGAGASEQELTAWRTAQAEYRQRADQWAADTPRATRNSALGAVTALLLGLVGGVIGGWMASGEPMNFTYYRTRGTA